MTHLTCLLTKWRVMSHSRTVTHSHVLIHAPCSRDFLLVYSRCQLTDMSDNSLASLSNLIELDLSYNQLARFPSAAIKACPLLRKLSLVNNQIDRLTDFALSSLTSLQYLDLSLNKITLIQSRAFEGAKSLKYLHLNGNQLR